MIVIRKTYRWRSLIGSAIRKTLQRGLLKPETPNALEGPCRGVQRLWAALSSLTTLELDRH
jgi:hypothetical protein